MQCIAMWPGTSRSLDHDHRRSCSWACAHEPRPSSPFSWASPTLGAACVYKAVGDGALMLETYGITSILIGFVAAWISAVISVRWMVGWLQKHGLEIFGYYRVVLAIVVYALLA
jgi:undecaprenyl-diphosphatase